MIVNFRQMIDYLSLVLNFQPTQTTENFTEESLKRLLNLAQQREYTHATTSGISKFFRVYQDFTWPANEVSYEAPQWCLKGFIIDFRDITNSPDSQIGTPTSIVFETYKKLRWAAYGPGDDRSIRVRYYLTPIDMVNEDDEPYWVPVIHRELLVWSAACILRSMAYKEIPPAWESQRNELRFAFNKYVSRGRPLMDPPSVLPTYDGLYNYADNGFDVIPGA